MKTFLFRFKERRTSTNISVVLPDSGSLILHELDIPHSDTRVSEFNKDGMQLDANVHCKYIFSVHAATYGAVLMEEIEPIGEKSFRNFPKCLGSIHAV